MARTLVLAAIGFALTVPSSFAADWALLGYTTQGEQVLVDRATIHRASFPEPQFGTPVTYVLAWTKLVSGKTGEMESVEEDAFNCRGQATGIQQVDYANQKNSFDLTARDKVVGLTLSDIAPDSILVWVQKAVCGK
jgi:hypothetical protein